MSVCRYQYWVSRYMYVFRERVVPDSGSLRIPEAKSMIPLPGGYYHDIKCFISYLIADSFWSSAAGHCIRSHHNSPSQRTIWSAGGLSVFSTDLLPICAGRFFLQVIRSSGRMPLLRWIFWWSLPGVSPSYDFYRSKR